MRPQSSAVAAEVTENRECGDRCGVNDVDQRSPRFLRSPLLKLELAEHLLVFARKPTLLAIVIVVFAAEEAMAVHTPHSALGAFGNIFARLHAEAFTLFLAATLALAARSLNAHIVERASRRTAGATSANGVAATCTHRDSPTCPICNCAI